MKRWKKKKTHFRGFEIVSCKLFPFLDKEIKIDFPFKTIIISLKSSLNIERSKLFPIPAIPWRHDSV